jgi:hypothetical protein
MDREEAMNQWAERTGKKDGDKPEASLSDIFTKEQSKKTTAPKTGNERLAATATEKLVALNNALAVTLFTLRMPGTALGISAAEEDFRTATYEALLTDPELCRTIISMGKASGKLGLLIAYAALFYGVVPTAVAEFRVHPLKAKLDERREARNAE